MTDKLYVQILNFFSALCDCFDVYPELIECYKQLISTKDFESIANIVTDYFKDNIEAIQKHDYENLKNFLILNCDIDFKKIFNSELGKQNSVTIWQHFDCIYKKIFPDLPAPVDNLTLVNSEPSKDLTEETGFINDLMQKITNLIPDLSDDMSPVEAIGKLMSGGNFNNLVMEINEEMQKKNLSQANLLKAMNDILK